MSDNQLTIIGTVGRDPELRFTNGGAAVCSFSVAWAPRKKDANGNWSDGDTSWFNCTAWRDLGENIAASISKGQRVMIVGSVSARDWEDKDGNKRTSVEINVDECGPSLRWATAQVERVGRSGGGGGGGGRKAAQPIYGDDEEPFVRDATEADL